MFYLTLILLIVLRSIDYVEYIDKRIGSRAVLCGTPLLLVK
jgi:hypothetical protein